MPEDKNKLDAARAEALKVAKQCYNMGILGAWFEAALSPFGKDYQSPEGRARIKEACFNELAAPRIFEAGGNSEDVARIQKAARNR